MALGWSGDVEAMEKKNLIVQEAADILHVRRERIWKLLRDGVLRARTNELDRRQKLIPRTLVEALLCDQGDLTQVIGRRGHAGSVESEPDHVLDVAPGIERRREELERVNPNPRPWPESIGMIADGTVPSSDSEEYLRRRVENEPSRTG